MAQIRNFGFMPYFQVDERHVGRLNAIANRIKAKYLEDGTDE